MLRQTGERGSADWRALPDHTWSCNPVRGRKATGEKLSIGERETSARRILVLAPTLGGEVRM
jgi:hypothetical protein